MQRSGLAIARDRHGSGEHLDALILTDMDVTRNASARVQADMNAQERAVGVRSCFDERQVLTGTRVVKMLARGRRDQSVSATASRRSRVVVIPRVASRRAFARIPGMRWSNRTHGGIETTSKDSETRVPVAAGSKR
jgi:hypothetical protein